MTGKGRIRINRSRSPWRDRFGRYTVLLDGAKLRKTENGDSKAFDVAAGEHRVRLADENTVGNFWLT